MDPSLVQALTVGGAAVAFFLVLKWIIDGKLHTHSEVEGLRQDKIDLLQINKDQSAALAASTEAHAKSLETIAVLRARLGDPPPPVVADSRDAL